MDVDEPRVRDAEQACIACCHPLPDGALFCLTCGAPQPRSGHPVDASLPVEPVPARTTVRGYLPAALALIIVLIAAGLYLTHPRTAPVAISPTNPPATSSATNAYLSAVHTKVLFRVNEAQDAIASGIQAGRSDSAGADFTTAEHLYSTALATLAALAPPEPYLRYQNDLLQGLTDYLRSAVAYDQWAVSHKPSLLRRAVSLSKTGLHFLTLASQDAAGT